MNEEKTQFVTIGLWVVTYIPLVLYLAYLAGDAGGGVFILLFCSYAGIVFAGVWMYLLEKIIRVVNKR